ncbi:unnamed protein product [Dibothriocephalus latus]|uniref:Uncharacterized protein n=1 Tax=Dibothriocephalus latus TaxID=60516 RepID=A0A3P6PNT5_DIBLA|nr:unnamed protein product [Dibothriocephalus latus]
MGMTAVMRFGLFSSGSGGGVCVTVAIDRVCIVRWWRLRLLCSHSLLGCYRPGSQHQRRLISAWGRVHPCSHSVRALAGGCCADTSAFIPIGRSNCAITVCAQTIVMCVCVQARQEVFLVHVPHGVAGGCIGVWGRLLHACILARCWVAGHRDPSDFLSAILLIEPHA